MDTSKLTVFERKVRLYALAVAADHTDRLGDINLTAVEEDVIDHYHLTAEEFEEGDYSFLIFKTFEEKRAIKS
jgi:hypothetical protein